MSKENEVKKCKMCGATLVGNNKNKKIGLCSNCARKAGQGGVGILAGIIILGTVALKIVKDVVKKE